jgi:hypothetical protein
MSVFRLPKKLCRDINTMMGKFWWGHQGNDSKIAWMSWSGLGRNKLNGGLGYRDLTSFNNALLAKQGWRLTKFPESLVGRIFQEKYYPSGDFLGSLLGSRPSYAWRSIWEAKPLIKEGLLWKIGDGSNIKIREDKWIPSTQTHMIQVNIQNISPEARVSDLINFETNWWNIPLLEQIFPAETVEQICNIPISPRLMKDVLVWAGTKNGMFSVRSAYNLDLELLDRQKGCSSFTPNTRSSWKLIWQLKIPRTVQLFLWRACNDILPTKGKLWKRKVVDNPLCPLCGTEFESSIHAIWLCEAAKAVWSACPARIQKCATGDSDFLTLFGLLSARLSLEDLQFFAMVAQRVWFRRNKYVFDGVFTPPRCLIKGASESLSDFRDASSLLLLNTQVQPPSLPVQWRKPPQGFVKLNWDAALEKNQRLIGVGVVARHFEGKVIAAKCSSQRYISDSSVAEAFGARLCTEFGLFLGLRSVIFEGDALEVVQELNRVNEDAGHLGNLIGDIRVLLRRFDCWSFAHVKREGNKVAHSLAKYAISHPQSRVWFNSFPSCVLGLVSSESDVYSSSV